MKNDHIIKYHFVKREDLYSEFASTLINGGKLKDNNYYYIDMDGRFSYKYYDYYYLLSIFLNLRELYLFKKGIIKHEEMYYYCLDKDKYIKVYILINNKYQFQFSIRSDLFGFTAACSSISKKFRLYKKRNKNCKSNYYPISKILAEYSEGNIANDKLIEIISKYIYNSRTIGGAFVWPLVLLENHYTNRKGKSCSIHDSLINFYRGIDSYIEDRVDLTLCEIKDFYEIYESIKNKSNYDEFVSQYKERFPNNVMFNYPKSNYKFNDKEKKLEMRLLFKWLSRFKTFKNYIDYFMLNDFVSKSYNPLSIIDKTTLKKKEIDYLRKNNIHSFSYLNKEKNEIVDGEQLLKVIMNVENLIKKRSLRIEKYLHL